MEQTSDPDFPPFTEEQFQYLSVGDKIADAFRIGAEIKRGVTDD